MSEKPKSAMGVLAVNRALTILDVFRGTSGPLSLKEMSERTGLYKSTILRLLGSLETFGYVRRLDNGSYTLGPTLAELGAVYRGSFNLEVHVQPVLDRIVAETNENASFYVPEGDKRICLFRSEAAQMIRDHIRVGDALEATQGASGKAITAFQGGLPHSAKADELMFSSIGERHPDMAAVAAPVFGMRGKLIGSLTISGPKNRFGPKERKTYSRIALREAVALSVQLGTAPGNLPEV
ncbi:MAG: IclR family transcriptional regulator [Pararhodobacter sp.]|nr:IclR family transcriptional regulator [Pararhodobacter sp.]